MYHFIFRQNDKFVHYIWTPFRSQAAAEKKDALNMRTHPFCCSCIILSFVERNDCLRNSVFHDQCRLTLNQWCDVVIEFLCQTLVIRQNLFNRYMFYMVSEVFSRSGDEFCIISSIHIFSLYGNYVSCKFAISTSVVC